MDCEECRKRKVEEEQEQWAIQDYLDELEPPEPNMRISRARRVKV